MKKYIFLILLASCQLHGYATDYYVAPNGHDKNKGTIDQPFRTINRAVQKMKPGDSCYLREGRYNETVELFNIKGSEFAPFTFQAYKNEQVVIDGTELIQVNWQLHENKIYKAKLENPTWQLFLNSKSLTAARWPNGNWDDGSVWDKKNSMAWPEKGKGKLGHHYNAAVSDFKFDITGAIATVNSGSFRTYTTVVTSHNIGEDNFKYDTTKNGIRTHFSNTEKVHTYGYFLEGKLGFLDVEGEWFYDMKSKMVYVWTPEGKHPDKFEIRAKNQSYAFDILNASHIKFKGLHFFGTTFSSNKSHHITIEDCNFLYPSYSKRMLHDISVIEVTRLLADRKNPKGFNVIRNCRFEYMDGPVLVMDGAHNIVENNYMHSIDISCTYAGGYTLDMSKAFDLVFRRNTVHTTGTSEQFKAGPRNIIEFNDLSKSGHLQNDGSLIQVSVASQPNSHTRYNWVHNTVKQGLRFDNKNTPNAPWGENGNMHHNVAWNTDRIFFKGDKHFIYNNISFGSHQNDLIISSNKVIQGHNHSTITRNNLSNKFSGHRTKPGKEYPVPGIVDHNWSGNIKGADIRTQLRDPDNLDFRPKADSDLVDAGALIEGKNSSYLGKAPDIGAYEYGDENYWIPGFQDKIASVPVPPYKSEKVKINADLMWLKAYKSEQSDVYFGADFEVISKATKKDKSYQGTFKNNIYTPAQLENGKTYYWRVDSIIGKKIRKGTVWTFKVEEL